MINRVTSFVKEVNVEMSKVSWPTWDELRGSTTVVIVLTLMFSLFTFVVDKICETSLNLIY